MSEHLVAVAEITKLARLLGITDPTELDFLTDLPPAAIREYRERVTDRLFDRDAKRLKGIATASKIVPVGISSKIAERAFGPLLCAAVASAVEPQRAVDIAKALGSTFLAECAVQLDPRRTAAIIAAVPPKMVTDVARELLSHGDHITMGRFVHVITEPALRAAAPAMSDTDLLRIAFFLEDKTAIDNVLHVVADRVPGVIRAAHDHQMWAEGIDLLDSIAPHNHAWIGDIIAALGGDALDALITAVAELDTWSTLLPITGAMSHDSLRLFAERPTIHTDTVLAAIITATADNDLWSQALPLVDALPDTTKPTLAARFGDLTREQLLAAILTASRGDNIHTLVDLALAADQAGRTRVLALIDDMDGIEEFLTALTADTPDTVWQALIQVRDDIPARLQTLLAERALELGRDDDAGELAPLGTTAN
ncbi:hypothetical protein [Nocardia sp. NPDC046763]|uniref:hypothetical protein n=1 Tax=Nocardia sp. NPDC046763 TaxID=3155256 RepID=UPI0033E13CA1